MTIRFPYNSKDFIFKRKQFPVKLAYCLTINRAEGQTLDSTGLDLSSPCFSHGQFYVGISRTREPANIKYLRFIQFRFDSESSLYRMFIWLADIKFNSYSIYRLELFNASL